MRRGCVVFVLALCVVAAARALGQSNEQDLGYTELQQEQGPNLVTGSGVRVMQIEADLDAGDNDFLPDPTDPQFAHVTITDQSGTGTISSHATAVGEYFYGSTSSFTPGITNVDAYEADDWLGTNFLNVDSTSLPASTTDRVANSSWIGDFTLQSTGGQDTASDLDALRRLDFVVQHDDLVNVVACDNPGGAQMPLMADSLNSITVGLSSGNAASETTNLSDSVYTAGRPAPDVVAPENETSYATPLVSSTAALLIDLAHNKPGLSNGTFISNGVTLQYGENVDVIKAAIMAGADRVASGITTYGQSLTQNGLDTRYGAGQLDVYNSYHVILGGRQTPGAISFYGWDYNPSSSNSGVEDYTFTGDSAAQATLAWEAHIASAISGNTRTFTATLADFQLSLYQMTGGKTLIASSVSTIDNTQNVYFTGLNSADTYELEVTRASSDTLGNWDYALAWDLTPTPEPGVGMMMIVGSAVLLRRRNPKPVI